MGSQPPKVRNRWRWLQKPWWFVRDVVRALSPARFSFFVALAGAAIFLLVQQGTEILRGLAEPNPDTKSVDVSSVIFFFAALTTWALHSWYWSRVMLDVHVSRVPAAHNGSSTRAIKWFRLHGPRILGILPPLIVAVACFFMAPRGYSNSAAGHPKSTLFLFGGLAILLALLLYIFFIVRRHWLDKAILANSGQSEGAKAPVPAASTEFSEERVRSLRENPGTWRAVLAFVLFSVVLQLLFLFQPVRTGLFIGSGAIVCLAAAAWVCFGSVIVFHASRLRLPLVGLLIAWAMLCSLWNDNHSIRTVSILPGELFGTG